MSTKNAVFTICAKNYLAQARTLGDSIRRYHPELAFYIFLADESQGLLDPEREKQCMIEVREIGIPQFRSMAFQYDVLELSCAIKPFCFDYLFRKDYERAIYLDPDICVYNSLDSIFDLLDRDFIVLTPHLTKMNIADDGSTSEDVFLFCGAYNLGFAALRHCQESSGFLEWWKVRLETKGFADRLDAYHVDQKWIDLIPGYFDQGVCISRNPGYNAAHWNMHQRPLSVSQGVYYVDEHPLVFFSLLIF